MPNHIKIFFILFLTMLFSIFNMPIYAQEASSSAVPTATPTPAGQSTTSTPAPFSPSPSLVSDTDKKQVLGAATSLGSTGSEKDLLKWGTVLITGILVFFAAFKIIRHGEE